VKKTILEVSKRIRGDIVKSIDFAYVSCYNSKLGNKAKELYTFYINKIKPLMITKKVKVGSIISYDYSDMSWQDTADEVRHGIVIKIYKKALFDEGALIDWVDVKWLSNGRVRSFVLHHMLNDKRVDLVSY